MSRIEGSPILIRASGVVNGVRIEIEEQHNDYPAIDDFREIVDFYGNGFGLRAEAVPAPVSAPPFVAAGTQPQQQANNGGGGFACPTHGTQNVKYDQRYNRWECKVKANQPQPWASDKPWTDRDGNNWWFCRSRS